MKFEEHFEERGVQADGSDRYTYRCHHGCGVVYLDVRDGKIEASAGPGATKRDVAKALKLYKKIIDKEQKEIWKEECAYHNQWC